jgi:hypothetical protein
MKKNLPYLLLLVIIIVFSACSGNKSDKGAGEPGSRLVSCDMENLGWMNLQTLSKDVAHSGKFATKVDSLNEYSFGLSNTFNNLSDSLPTSVDVSMWMFFTQLKTKSSVIISIDSVNKNIFWKGISITDSIKAASQWQEIKVNFEIPKKIMPTDNIKIYVWNNEKRAIYMDDLKLLFHYQ